MFLLSSCIFLSIQHGHLLVQSFTPFVLPPTQTSRTTRKSHFRTILDKQGQSFGTSDYSQGAATSNDDNETPHSTKEVTTMEFKKYPSIKNSYQERILAEYISAIEEGQCSDDFIVEEKAHGANFAFYYDGLNLKTASRSGFLENDGESFYRSHFIKEKYANSIQKLYTSLGGSCHNEEDNTDVQSGPNTAICVVGELIGGSYQHPDVESTSLKRIQKGIDYCPGHEFYAFDLYVLDTNHSVDEGTTKPPNNDMERLEMYRLFELAGLFYAKPLFRGTLSECLAFPNNFKTHIPKWLGLPEHPSDNIAEGKVIKPLRAAYLHTGLSIILKDKAKAFVEVAERKTKGKKSSGLSESAQELADKLCAYVTSNRLSNVLSKLSDRETLTYKDMRRVQGLFLQDAMEEFREDNGDAMDSLKKKEVKSIQKCFEYEAMALIMETLPQS